MNTTPTNSPPRPGHRPGYISVISVLVFSGALFAVLLATYRTTIQSQEVQTSAQLRIDYAHREQALLRAVLTEVPNQAMKCMMGDSGDTGWTITNRWRWIFENARNKADGEFALTDDVASALGIPSSTVSGNTGDGAEGHIVNNVIPTIEQSSNYLFYINSGTNGTGTSLGTNYPEALVLGDSAVAQLDRDRPIITTDKTYSGGALFKSIPYPNVHFGYSTQGQNFVAKRNWWAFSVEYGTTSEGVTGIATVRKNYVLSIYEVPSQLAMGSTSLTYLGQHADGSAWANVAIQGGVFASRAATQGSISLERLASRRGITLSDSSVVGGVSQDQFTGSRPTREIYEAENSDFVPLSNSSDSGLVAFIPISRSTLAFDDLTDTADDGRASPTSWNWYSRPAMQCAMKLRIEEVAAPDDQTPTRISFTYLEGGIEVTSYFTRGTDWPTESSTEGATFPFHTESLPSGRYGIAVYVGRMAAWLAANGADSTDVNHSLTVNANYRDNTDVAQPSIPSLDTDPALIFRDSKDLTMFPNGFSLVTPFRMYLANDVNIVATGTDLSGDSVYPPLSLFAPEKRFGVREQALSIDFVGQLNYLGTDDANPIRPLDLRSGNNDEIVAENIRADLHAIADPSLLPPVNQMNWLVVIEEVR